MISPTACGALFSARPTPQSLQNLVEPWWNPGGTLVQPWCNPRGTLPQGRPGPPRSLSGLRPQSFQLFGKKLGAPVVPFYPFVGEGSPTKIDYKKKGTLILTSLLEDLEDKGAWGCSKVHGGPVLFLAHGAVCKLWFRGCCELRTRCSGR